MHARSRPVREYFLFAAFLFAAFLFAAIVASIAVADESLRPELSHIAEQAESIAKQHGFKSISIGDFAAPPIYASAAGAGIRRVLTEEIQRLRLEVKPSGGDFGVSGRYLVTNKYDRLEPQQYEEFKRSIVPHLRIEADFYDAGGISLMADDKPGPVIADVVGFGFSTPEETMARVLGANVDFDLNKGMNAAIGSFTKKTAVIRPGDWAAASSTSKFSFRVLVQGRPVPISMQGGQPFVNLNRGDEFELEFINNDGTEVAVEFMLDGLSSFAFSEMRKNEEPGSPPNYRRWIVPRSRNFVLPGWHRTNEKVDRFEVTKFSESAAGIAGAAGIAHGTLSVFAQTTRPKPPPPPPVIAYKELPPERTSIEPRMTAMPPPSNVTANSALPEVGVGFGRAFEMRIQDDQTTREYGSPRAVITIRYIKTAL